MPKDINARVCAICDKEIDRTAKFFTVQYEHPCGEQITTLWLGSRGCLTEFMALAERDKDALFMYMGSTTKRGSKAKTVNLKAIIAERREQERARDKERYARDA